MCLIIRALATASYSYPRCILERDLPYKVRGFPHSSAGKEYTYNAGDPGSIPKSRRSGEGNGYPLLSDQCKEIEENNRTGKTRDLFKKISNTKGTFHAKMSTIKDRNGMDLSEAEDIKKRWQEFTEELYKKRV